MSEKQKKTSNIVDIVTFVLVLLMILYLNLKVGANEKTPLTILQFVAPLVLVIYIIIQKILKKGSIVIKGKMDGVVLAFTLITCVPLVFKTYASLEGTINFIFKYFVAYSLYVLVRNVANSTKRKNILIDVTLISSLIIIIFGIDLITADRLTRIIQRLGLKYTDNTRLTSTFGYANSVAVYIGALTFLSIARFNNTKNKLLKIPYAAYVILGLVTVYLTNSRIVTLLLLLLLIIYMIVKNVARIKKYIKVHGSKKIVITIVGIFVIFLVAGIVIMTTKEPLVINANGRMQRELISPKADFEYKVDLDITAVGASLDEEEDVFELRIVENNKYLHSDVTTKETIKDFSGTKTLQFTTKSDTYMVYIEIRNKTKNGSITVNGCYVNGKEYIVKYKFMPVKVSRMLTTVFNPNTKSLMQRLQFYDIGLTIAKDNLLIGVGGNSWKTLYKSIQDYPFNIKEYHSYIIELLASYGVLGLGTYILMVVYTLVLCIKNIKNKNTEAHEKETMLCILFSFLLLIIHNVMDFDMSFLVVISLVYTYIALINKQDKKESKIAIADYVIIPLLLLLTVLNVNSYIAKGKKTNEEKYALVGYSQSYQYKRMFDLEMKKTFNEEFFKLGIGLMKNEPQYNQLEILEKFFLGINTTELANEQKYTYFDALITAIEKNAQDKPMYITRVKKRNELFLRLIKELDNYSQTTDEVNFSKLKLRVYMVAIGEYEQNVKNISEYTRNGNTEEITKEILEDYEHIISEIKEICEK